MDDTHALATYRRDAGWLAREIHHFDSLTSTNDVLKALAREGAEDGTLVLAEEQTAGRGRHQRRWIAPPQTSLLMALLFRPQGPFGYRASRITMLCGLSLLETVQEVTGLPVQLKWPNDLILERGAAWKKVAGMLSEIGGDPPDFLIVGLGLNVNVSEAQLLAVAPRATSLMAEVGSAVDRVALLQTFLARTERYCDRLRSGWDPQPLWAEQLAWMGRPVDVVTSNEVVTGVAEAVDDEGALILRKSGGQQRRFSAGDVSLRPTST